MKIAPLAVQYVDHMGSDLSVVNSARVSFHKVHDKIEEGDEKLINYLADHKHYSPFNHAFMTFRIKAPIFVARQLVKHKFMPWNEVSRRYVDDEPEFFYPEVWRAKAENVKQGSSDSEVHIGNVIVDETYEGNFGDTEGHVYRADDVMALSVRMYQSLLEEGVAPEQARMVLPQNMMTEWYWSGTLGAYADMLRLRLDPHTQQESREVAKLIYNKVEELFPISIKALLK